MDINKYSKLDSFYSKILPITHIKKTQAPSQTKLHQVTRSDAHTHIHLRTHTLHIILVSNEKYCELSFEFSVSFHILILFLKRNVKIIVVNEQIVYEK